MHAKYNCLYVFCQFINLKMAISAETGRLLLHGQHEASDRGSGVGVGGQGTARVKGNWER